MAIDLKIQSVTAHMDILHAAIARLRRKNDQLMKMCGRLINYLLKEYQRVGLAL